MNKEKINELVDLMFNFDEKELEKETDFLKEYKKIKEQNKKISAELELYKDNNIYLNNKLEKQQQVLDKIKEYIKENANANVDYILDLLEEIE